jgi:hypothetical protein|tara:strand:+ start:749 stop:949 length:201 start_codon:yes stop_codon:yes gene_type:complete
MKESTKENTKESTSGYLEELHRSFTEYLRGHTLSELEESMLRANLTINEAEALEESLRRPSVRKSV